MARKPTAAELAEENKRLSAENSILSRALQSVMFSDGQREPAIYLNQGVAAERFDLDEGTYTLRLYRPTSADGGIVITSYCCAGQASQVSADRLDDLEARYLGDYSDHTLAMRIAIERLRVVRNRLCDRQTFTQLAVPTEALNPEADHASKGQGESGSPESSPVLPLTG